MATPPRARRKLLTLGLPILLLLFAAWWINRQLEPNRLTATVLQKAGAGLQLDLRFQGTPQYALKPEPRLLIPNFSARVPGGKVFLFARRAEISLPWSTITGDEPVITRVELDRPILNLPGLRSWLASRPQVPFKLPVLSKGMRVVDGTIKDQGFSVTGLTLELPRLKTGDPLHVVADGVLQQDKNALAFKLDFNAATLRSVSDFTLHGSGELQQSPTPVKFTLAANGRYQSMDSVFSLDTQSLKLEISPPLATLSGKAQVAFGKQLQWRFDGVLADWPKTWPALPQPLAANSKDLPVQLSYIGAPDLSDPIALTVIRKPTELQATLRVRELSGWLSTAKHSPLPPLNGTLRTPLLAIDGIKMEGVEIQISDGKAAGAPP